MARQLSKAQARLSTATLQAILRGTYKAKVRRLHDGAGLYLRLNPTQAGGYWLLRYHHNEIERVMGIGPLDAVPAAEARERARAAPTASQWRRSAARTARRKKSGSGTCRASHHLRGRGRHRSGAAKEGDRQIEDSGAPPALLVIAPPRRSVER